MRCVSMQISPCRSSRLTRSSPRLARYLCSHGVLSHLIDAIWFPLLCWALALIEHGQLHTCQSAPGVPTETLPAKGGEREGTRASEGTGDGRGKQGGAEGLFRKVGISSAQYREPERDRQTHRQRQRETHREEDRDTSCKGGRERERERELARVLEMAEKSWLVLRDCLEKLESLLSTENQTETDRQTKTERGRETHRE